MRGRGRWHAVGWAERDRVGSTAPALGVWLAGPGRFRVRPSPQRPICSMTCPVPFASCPPHHLVALHFSPAMTGQLPCSEAGSNTPSERMLQKSMASPCAGLMARPCRGRRGRSRG